MGTPTLRLPWIRLVVIGIASILMFPLLVLLWLSLVKQWAYPQLWNSLFTLDNWKLLLSNEQSLWHSLWLSLGFSGIMASVCTILGLLISKEISYSPWRKPLQAVAFYPYLIAPVVLGTMLRYYFLRWGLVGSWAGVALAQFLFVFPYSILFFSGYWNAHTQSLHQQAHTLGATPLQTFIKITIPSSKQWMVVCAFQCFLISWFEYGITQVIGLGRVSTLTIKVVQLVREANPHLAAVASVLMLLPPIALLLFNRQALKLGANN